MATAMKKCRVCGKEYEACHSFKQAAGVFRWQEVSCSPECGSIYLAKIEKSRGINHSDGAGLKENIRPTEVFDVCTVQSVETDESDIIDECELDAELDEYFDNAE